MGFISDVDETPIADNIQFLGANQPNTTGFPSRFILQSGTVITSDDMTKFLRELRSVAHSSPFQVIVFNPYFPRFDQLANVEMDTFKSSIFSTALVVAPLLIPSSYILQSFAKIVFLIVFLGAVHGLIVLPALLAAYYSRRNNFNLAVALVKAVFIHCKLLRSVNVMEGGIIGTFSPLEVGNSTEGGARTSFHTEERISSSNVHDGPEESIGRESARIVESRRSEVRDQLREMSLEDDSFDMGVI